jgi:hypothetical protein
MGLRFSDLFYPHEYSFVPPPEFYQDFCKPRRIILNDYLHESAFFLQLKIRSKGRTSCSMCPTPEMTSSWNLPCICPIINSRSNRSVPASTSRRAVLHERNSDDSDVNQSVRVGQPKRFSHYRISHLSSRAQCLPMEFAISRVGDSRKWMAPGSPGLISALTRRSVSLGS